MASSSNEIYLAAIEGGGTTFVVSVARVIAPLHERRTVVSRGDGGNNRGNDDDVLQIGPSTLQVLRTATIPQRDSSTGGIPARTPSQILDEVCSFLRRHAPPGGRYSAAGIATFGPAGVDPARESDYGTILAGSPKREWRGVNLLTPIARACGLSGNGGRIGFDTDVNAPALAEFRHRRHLQEKQWQRKTQQSPDDKPLTSLSYVTIGTGVGVGLVLNSHPIHGLLHPEGGHVAVRPLEGDKFRGYSWGTEKSPYGGVGTVEGIASSVALTERLLQMERDSDGEKGSDDGAGDSNSSVRSREVLATLPDTHPLWIHATNAIASLCVSIILLTSCQKIVLGGGVMRRRALYGMIRRRTWALLNGYLDSVDELSVEERLEHIIVGGSWDGTGSGLVGAFALALDAYENNSSEKEEKSNHIDPTEKKYIEEEKGQQSFASGMLAGIGLSFGCVLLSYLLGHGRPRHR